MGETVKTRRVAARKLKPGDMLADGAVVDTVKMSEGKRTQTRTKVYGQPVRSGYPIDVDVVIVALEGCGGVRRFWPRQKVELRDG